LYAASRGTRARSARALLLGLSSANVSGPRAVALSRPRSREFGLRLEPLRAL